MDQYFIVKATLKDKQQREANFVSKQQFAGKYISSDNKGFYIYYFRDFLYKLIDKENIIDIDVNQISYYEWICFRNIIPRI